MTLIVARIHGDEITAVSDTKITFTASHWEHPERKTRRVYDDPVLKLAIVHPHLAIGTAGDEPATALEKVSQYWNLSIDELLSFLCNYSATSDTGFVVCALAPARLWRVSDGIVYERTEHREAHEGDDEPHEIFADLYSEWPDDIAAPFRLISSMHGITDGPWKRNDLSAGGHAVHLTTVQGEFQYLQFDTTVLEPTPGNGPLFRQHFATGHESTPGAFAIFIPQRQHQILFAHQRPWEPIRLKAETIDDLISVAYDLHGQYLKLAGA
ncbi:hypothetical protein [Nocardia farcinica]|uniref:hypothetical protein n=1 Tax=Nocardia farcinica TaxID=37329 RepID=UPI0024575EF1|nr:hypothetical protein [Nocardia farcinica]